MKETGRTLAILLIVACLALAFLAGRVTATGSTPAAVMFSAASRSTVDVP